LNAWVISVLVFITNGPPIAIGWALGRGFGLGSPAGTEPYPR
jgi:hypothetical protein